MIVMLTVDRLGRKPLVNYGLILSGICLCAMLGLSAYQYHTEQQAWISYTSVAFFAMMSLANTAATTVVPILRSELVPQNIRSLNCAISTVTNAIYALTLCIVFPIVLAAVGPYSLLMFIIPLTIGTVYLWFKLPETKGQTVEQIVSGLRKTSISPMQFLTIADTVRKISVASVTGREIVHDINDEERERMMAIVAEAVERQNERNASMGSSHGAGAHLISTHAADGTAPTFE